MVEENGNGSGSVGSPGSPGTEGGGLGGHGGHGGTGGHGIRGEQGEKGVVGDKGASGEDTFMTQSLWLGWTRWTWVRIAFAFVVFMSAFGFYREQQFEAREDREARQEVIDKDYISCVRGNDTREVVRDIVELSNGPTDLTLVPGFEALDPEMKQFLINLRDATAEADDGESFKEAALALLAIRDCEKEFPDANHDLPTEE